jgi:hypothetical protein
MSEQAFQQDAFQQDAFQQQSGGTLNAVLSATEAPDIVSISLTRKKKNFGALRFHRLMLERPGIVLAAIALSARMECYEEPDRVSISMSVVPFSKDEDGLTDDDILEIIAFTEFFADDLV